MGTSSTPRKKGDEFLLAAGGDGWVDVEAVIREMMRFVMPGLAHRTVARTRKGTDEDEPRRRDPVRVGSRQVARSTLQNAIRNGKWVREGDRVRHRDHPGEQVADRGDSPEGWAVPGLDDVREHLASVEWLRGFTAWHWAAVILTHVEVADAPGRPQENAKDSNFLTPTEFAALGITGLKSKDTVRRYHRLAMQRWGRRLEPGERIDIPDPETWPTTRQNHEPDTRPPRPPRVAIDSQDSVVKGALDHYGFDAPDVLHGYADEADRRLQKRRRQRIKVVNGERT